MQDVHEQPLWLRWFLNAENTDVAALRTALRVVPNEFWPSVYQDISRGLSELITEEDAFPTRRDPTLEMKRTLLREERERRAAS